MRTLFLLITGLILFVHLSAFRTSFTASRFTLSPSTSQAAESPVVKEIFSAGAGAVKTEYKGITIVARPEYMPLAMQAIDLVAQAPQYMGVSLPTPKYWVLKEQIFDTDGNPALGIADPNVGVVASTVLEPYTNGQIRSVAAITGNLAHEETHLLGAGYGNEAHEWIKPRQEAFVAALKRQGY